LRVFGSGCLVGLYYESFGGTVVIDDNRVREHADEALRFALAHNYSNNVIRPLLDATHGVGIQAHEIHCCPVHDAPTGAGVLLVENPTLVQEWNRRDDAYLDHMLEKMRFEAHLNDYLRRGHR
jgi:hypothetical protein